MSPRFFTPLAAVALLVLAGCTTPAPKPPAGPVAQPPATPPVPQPVAPKGEPKPVTPPADLRPATIRGSQETSALLDNFTAFVRTVDGQPVSAGRDGWDQPITLSAGPHRLGVEFVRGSFFARAELTLAAKPAAAYVVRHTSDAQVYGQHTYCEFWITDLASGQPAGPRKRVTLAKVPGGN